jgi:RimJ/RimL family protein N-acetyltransferase
MIDMANEFAARRNGNVLGAMLRTERLILDCWTSSDWEAFRPIAIDVEVMRYINGGVPWSDEEIQNFVYRQVMLYSARGFCRWKLLDASNGELIGFCGPGIWRDAADPEIGWWLARPYWGRGLATEAARAALQDAFERVRLKRVISIAMPDNTASIGVMKKLGLTFDAEFESDGLTLVRYAIERLGEID